MLKGFYTILNFKNATSHIFKFQFVILRNKNTISV